MKHAGKSITIESFSLSVIPLPAFFCLSSFPAFTVSTSSNLLTIPSQHFQKIRKEARSDSPATTPTHARTTSTPKSQKRSKDLIYDGNQANSDDEEILTTPAKRAKVRAEAKVKAEGQENCQTVAQFKIEESMGNNVVDLERDE